MSRKPISQAQAALIFLGVMIGLWILGAGAGLMVERSAARLEPAAPVTAEQARVQTPPEPRLQIDPLADRQVMIGPERLASTWGWTDRAHGRAHIPVQRAMQRLAEQGWPTPEAGQ